LTPRECADVLERGQVAYIGVISNGEPYVTPMSYVVHNGDVVFRTAAGRRVDAMQENPRVCVTISGDRDGHGWESIVFWGDARFIDEPAERSEIVAGLLAKYHTESAFSGSTPSVLSEERFVAAITPEILTGRSSGGGFTPPTRPGRL
ncbi:pyridoxamine 5'-phosphate oxidase family protein, partial [bacterium]|nr:pyridoxamine 5'-phosphate oxidase family protein [bacterium]